MLLVRLLLFILTLFHANEAHRSGQQGQNKLKSDIHVCASKQIGINEEFNFVSIFKKKVLDIYICARKTSTELRMEGYFCIYVWMAKRPAVQVMKLYDKIGRKIIIKAIFLNTDMNYSL